MPSIINNATLTVTINEDVKLNGQQVGSKIIQTISNVNEASRRVFSVPIFETQILALSSSAGAGTYVTADIQYIRISNLDDTNFLRLSFSSGSLNRYDMKLPAKRSAIFASPSVSGSASGAGFNGFVNFDSMKATADTEAVDVELFIASI
jgi:hypothetical protein